MRIYARGRGGALAFSLLALVALLPCSAAQGQGEVYDYTTGVRGTRLWISAGLSAVKGIVIYGNGAGGDARNAVDVPWLRQFAELHDFALIGTSNWGNLSGGEITTWETHLAELATLSSHPELAHAPWAPMGFSNGGSMSYGFNALRPEKTIAFVANKGCCYNIATPSTAALKTPGILIAGELDTNLRRNNIKALFDANRPRGALWSWVEQEGMAHDGLAFELILPFFSEAIRLRYPEGGTPTAAGGVTLATINEASGWLADQTTRKGGLTEIAAYAEFAGDKTRAGWLLNENVATAYRAFSTYDSPVRIDFADAPFQPWPFATLFGLQSPTTVRLTLDVADLADWSRIEILNNATSLLTLTPGVSTTGVFAVDAPIDRPGVYGFSALVTHGDGVAKSTSNLLAYTVVPEPATGGGLLIAAAATVALARPGGEPSKRRDRRGFAVQRFSASRGRARGPRATTFATGRSSIPTSRAGGDTQHSREHHQKARRFRDDDQTGEVKINRNCGTVI